ncbi:hypothetical protein HYQ46_006461 [Verticillium longisporum]|nr:hypothetical protein HYQ46_006461 [Verticillium longisporum]
MTSARQKAQPQLSRSQTYQEPYRRSSEAPKAREKSSHKKSSSGPKDAPATSPIAVDLSSARVPPSFLNAGTTPPMVPESPPRKTQLPRANTMREADYNRPSPQPTMSRSQTYHYAGDHDMRSPASADPRGRSRNRLQAQVSESDSDDEEAERRYREARRRERRHKTHSPEPLPQDYPPPPPLTRATTARYAVNNGRTVPMHGEPVYAYRDESPPRKSKGSYYPSAHVRVAEVRPQMPSREGAYSSSGGGPYFGKVKTAKSYTPDDVQYSNIPHHRGYHEEAYA